jgi:DNA-directed RNA polymerase specialized sigma24 family protein
LPEPAKIQGWIFLIARNAIIDRYRTRKEFVALPDTLAAEAEAAPEELEASRLRFEG